MVSVKVYTFFWRIRYIAMTSCWLATTAHGFFHINIDNEDNAVINWGGG
jgi:hypothetical protein